MCEHLNADQSALCLPKYILVRLGECILAHHGFVLPHKAVPYHDCPYGLK